MAGHHSHAPSVETRRMKQIALAILLPLGLVTAAALVWLWPGGIEREQRDQPAHVPAVVTAVDAEGCTPDPHGAAEPCGTAVLEMRPGDDATDTGVADGDRIEVALPHGPGAVVMEVGDHVLATATSGSGDDVVWSVVDHQRSSGLWILAVGFVLAIVAFGRWRGVRSLIGLGVTFALITLFFVPAVLAGTAPVLAAAVTCAAVVLVVLHVTHGTGLVATVAVLGTLASLAVTWLLSWAAVSALHLSGITDDLSIAISLDHGIDAQGLLLAGIMIGSLGVLDDVTVTQSATVAEIARANPRHTFADLYAAGSRVGRAHIASVINTIVLAYAGSSLPLLVLIMANNDSFSAIVTDQLIAQEVVRSAVATLGLVAAVPITTLLAAWVGNGFRDEDDDYADDRALHIDEAYKE